MLAVLEWGADCRGRQFELAVTCSGLARPPHLLLLLVLAATPVAEMRRLERSDVGELRVWVLEHFSFFFLLRALQIFISFVANKFPI